MRLRSSFAAEVLPLSSAAVTALERSRGYFVAISSVGTQVRNPGTSDASMSKHVVNRLIEFIVLAGSSCSFLLWKTQDDSLCGTEYHSVRAFVLAPQLASSARDCSPRLESKSPSMQSHFLLQQRHSVSRPGARTSFPEGSWTTIRARVFHSRTLTRFQVLLIKLGHRRGGARVEGCDPQAGCTREQAKYSQALGGMLRGVILFVLCICHLWKFKSLLHSCSVPVHEVYVE